MRLISVTSAAAGAVAPAFLQCSAGAALRRKQAAMRRDIPGECVQRPVAGVGLRRGHRGHRRRPGEGPWAFRRDDINF